MADFHVSGFLRSVQVGVRGTGSFPANGQRGRGGAELTVNGPAFGRAGLGANGDGLFAAAGGIALNVFARAESNGTSSRAIIGGGIAGAFGIFPLPFAVTGEVGVGINTETRAAVLRTNIGLEAVIPTAINTNSLTNGALSTSALSVGVSYVPLIDLSNGQVEHGLSAGVRFNWLGGVF